MTINGSLWVRINALVAHLASEAAPGDVAPFANREIYDSTGTLMDLVQNAADEGFALDVPAGRQPEDRQLLLDRILAAVLNTQVRVDRTNNPALKGYRVPLVIGDLDVVLPALSAAFGPLPEVVNPNHGSPLHEAGH